MHKPLSLLTLLVLPALFACSAGNPAEDSEAEQEQALVAAHQAAESAAEPPADNAAIAPPPAPECEASHVQGLIGQTIDDAKLEQAKVDAGAENVRVLTPDQMVTMEFDGTRLSIEVDAQGMITALRCG